MTAAPNEGAREWMPSSETREELVREFAEPTLSLQEIRERLDSMLAITGLRAQQDAATEIRAKQMIGAFDYRAYFYERENEIERLEAGKGKG